MSELQTALLIGDHVWKFNRLKGTKYRRRHVNIDLTPKEIRALGFALIDPNATPSTFTPADHRTLQAKLEKALEELARGRTLTDEELEVVRKFRAETLPKAPGPWTPKRGNRVAIAGQVLFTGSRTPYDDGDLQVGGTAVYVKFDDKLYPHKFCHLVKHGDRFQWCTEVKAPAPEGTP